MLHIKCPHCGLRSQNEFSYGGDATVKRPELNKEVSDQDWDNFVYLRKSPRGKHLELWQHISGCRQWFNVARNTTTDEIVKIYNMGEGSPEVTTNEPSTPCGEPSIGSGNFSTTNRSS